MRVALACLLLLAPDQTYELKYRFAKGMSYVDSQERVWKQTKLANGRRLEYHFTHTIKVRRTILEADETAHPVAERVEVTHYRVDTRKSPKQEDLGLRLEACEGKTFVWKRLKTRWGLFDEKGEVTGKHKRLVGYLKNWRDARLPKEPQSIGGSWEVTAKRFLQTAGLPLTPNLQGMAVFTLEKVERGIATIRFDVHYTFRDPQNVWTVAQKGVWTFDAKRGRDVSMVMRGEVLIDKGVKGKGTVTLRREVTYLP